MSPTSSSPAPFPRSVVTWNVNSVRTRLERVIDFLQREQPDVLCLQETKVTDEQFPAEAIEAAGYRVVTHGQKTYNGVAILSKEPAGAVTRGFEGNPLPEQARVIAAEVGGLTVVNLYVVNGRSMDDPAFEAKLAWLDALQAWLERTYSPEQPLLICGDFNIAPDERDVYDPEKWRDRVLVSEPERQRLRAMLDWGLSDLLRLHTEEGGIFSWWDYRQGAFPRGWGLRIDLLLGTAKVAARSSAVVVDREERKASTGPGKPSDHAPVIARLARDPDAEVPA